MSELPYSADLPIGMLRGITGDLGGCKVDIGKVERVIEIERIDETAPIREPHVVPARPEEVPA